MATETTNPMVKVFDKQGHHHDYELKITDYQAAFTAGLTLPQYYNQKFASDYSEDDFARLGSPLQQMLSSSGLAIKRDDRYGIKSSRMMDVLDGSPMMGVVRPDGSQALTVAGRMLFPAVILQWIESELMSRWDSYEGVFNRMVALTSSSDSPRVDQPIVNLTGPRDSLAQPIAQGAQPITMVSISISDKTYKIPTKSIGFEITDEASKNTTLDFVGMTLQQQVIGQRIGLINQYLSAMINGDVDTGVASLSSETAQSYDSAISAAGTITNKAWVKWLRKDWHKLTIDWVICDIDTYLAIENRTGRPVIVGDAGNDIRLTSVPQAANPSIPGAVMFFIVEAGVIPANTLIGIDSRKAMHRMVYTGGSYQAVEQYVMRRTTAMRFDFAEMVVRMMANGDGWKKLTLTV